MKKEIKNVTASVRAKLQNKARETNRPFAEILQYYGMERFLYRLSQSKYADHFILKGALLFSVWEIPQRRTTMDIDLLAYYDNAISKIENVIRDVCHLKTDPDGLIFEAATVSGQKIKEDADYEGVRIKFRGLLEKSRIPMQIDFGFGDVVFPKPKTIHYPALLDFPKPHLKGYPVETVIAEKFEAMVKLGILNSRMKDFYDLWLIIRQFELNEENIAKAIKKTFTHRGTLLPNDIPLFAEEIYDETSDRQTLWKAFHTKNQIKHAPEKLRDVAKFIEKFLIGTINSGDTILN